MKTFASAALAMLLVTTMSAPSARADDKADIKAVFAKIEKAFRNKDIKTITATSTPDFTETSHGTTMNAKQAEAMLQQQFASTKKVTEMKMTPDVITVKGKSAEVMGTMKFAGVVVDAQGQMGKKGATHKLVSVGKSKVGLVKGAHGWMVKSVEDLSEETTVDGKKLVGGPPPPPKKK